MGCTQTKHQKCCPGSNCRTSKCGCLSSIGKFCRCLRSDCKMSHTKIPEFVEQLPPWYIKLYGHRKLKKTKQGNIKKLKLAHKLPENLKTLKIYIQIEKVEITSIRIFGNYVIILKLICNSYNSLIIQCLGT